MACKVRNIERWDEGVGIRFDSVEVYGLDGMVKVIDSLMECMKELKEEGGRRWRYMNLNCIKVTYGQDYRVYAVAYADREDYMFIPDPVRLGMRFSCLNRTLADSGYYTSSEHFPVFHRVIKKEGEVSIECLIPVFEVKKVLEVFFRTGKTGFYCKKRYEMVFDAEYPMVNIYFSVSAVPV